MIFIFNIEINCPGETRLPTTYVYIWRGPAMAAAILSWWWCVPNDGGGTAGWRVVCAWW